MLRGASIHSWNTFTGTGKCSGSQGCKHRTRRMLAEGVGSTFDGEECWCQGRDLPVVAIYEVYNLRALASIMGR